VTNIKLSWDRITGKMIPQVADVVRPAFSAWRDERSPTEPLAARASPTGAECRAGIVGG
jgi:hypothetical protein